MKDKKSKFLNIILLSITTVLAALNFCDGIIFFVQLKPRGMVHVAITGLLLACALVLAQDCRTDK